MGKEKISIFCQAPGDVIHTLALYHKYRDKADISIYCINVKVIFEFIKSLNLELKQLEFIPYDINFSIKKPLSIFSARRQIWQRFNKLFRAKNNETIYFFAIWFDWYSFFFLSQLSSKNKLVFYKHYQSVTEEGKKKYTLKEKIVLLQYHIITGLKLQFTDEKTVKRLLFPYQEYGIASQQPIDIKQNLFKSYLYKTKNNSEKSILFFESDLEKYQLFSNYKVEIKIIIQAVQSQGFTVFVKGHPSLGVTKEIEEICNFTIPKEIPAELIDVSPFSCVLGIQSFSMAYFAKEKHKVVSLVHLLSFVNDSDKKMYIDYLNVNSNHKIEYPKNISDLCL